MLSWGDILSNMTFTTYEWSKALKVECDDRYPTTLRSWNSGTLDLPDDGVHYGFVYSGQCTLTTANNEYNLTEAMYFRCKGSINIKNGKGFIATRHDQDCTFMIGGPAENRGRLAYIDGCSDSLLISPDVLGDPCLNLLYFPPNIDQTPHTHPSDRIGCVLSGKGECLTPTETISLYPGCLFRIAAEGIHKFKTIDSSMRVIAYHPDSDFGPTNSNHPMINKTIVNGISASELQSIQTQRV